MKTFDAKQSTWEGLWYHPETGGFTSSVINLAKLKEFKGNVRVYVHKNKYFNNGENGRPNYCFCIKDANSDTFNDVDIIDDERCGEWIWSEKLCGMTIFEGYVCSKCGFAIGYKTTNFCPECGRKMMNGESYI